MAPRTGLGIIYTARLSVPAKAAATLHCHATVLDRKKNEERRLDRAASEAGKVTCPRIRQAWKEDTFADYSNFKPNTVAEATT